MQTIPPFPGSHDARSSTDDANVHTLRELQSPAPSGNVNSVTANTKDRVGSSGPATLGKRASNGEDPDPNGNDGRPKQIGIEENFDGILGFSRQSTDSWWEHGPLLAE